MEEQRRLQAKLIQEIEGAVVDAPQGEADQQQCGLFLTAGQGGPAGGAGFCSRYSYSTEERKMLETRIRDLCSRALAFANSLEEFKNGGRNYFTLKAELFKIM